MSRLLAGLVTLAVVIGMAAPVSTQTIGVVLMHGNTDSPDRTTALLAAAMEGAGYLVERPEMWWSYRRRRDRPLLDCLAELEAPMARLAGRGAHAIVVAAAVDADQVRQDTRDAVARSTGVLGWKVLMPFVKPESGVGIGQGIELVAANEALTVAQIMQQAWDKGHIPRMVSIPINLDNPGEEKIVEHTYAGMLVYDHPGNTYKVYMLRADFGPKAPKPDARAIIRQKIAPSRANFFLTTINGELIRGVLLINYDSGPRYFDITTTVQGENYFRDAKALRPAPR